MADNNPSLESLAATVSETVNALSAKLKEIACPAPSFAEDGLVEYPKLPELNGLRFQLIDAAADLYRLALGPTDNSMFAPLHVGSPTLHTKESDQLTRSSSIMTPPSSASSTTLTSGTPSLLVVQHHIVRSPPR